MKKVKSKKVFPNGYFTGCKHEQAAYARSDAGTASAVAKVYR
jgi:hypothetical protein